MYSTKRVRTRIEPSEKPKVTGRLFISDKYLHQAKNLTEKSYNI